MSPWPLLTAGDTPVEHIIDTDGDGIPDYWELARGLDPADPSDGPAITLSPTTGYTNLEIYLNSLVP